MLWHEIVGLLKDWTEDRISELRNKSLEIIQIKTQRDKA